MKQTPSPELNQYHYNTAAYCKTTGLPMLNRETYQPHADTWLSKTRCKRAKQPVQEGEQPVAFLRMATGYAALYDRTPK